MFDGHRGFAAPSRVFSWLVSLAVSVESLPAGYVNEGQ